MKKKHLPAIQNRRYPPQKTHPPAIRFNGQRSLMQPLNKYLKNRTVRGRDVCGVVERTVIMRDQYGNTVRMNEKHAFLNVKHQKGARYYAHYSDKK